MALDPQQFQDFRKTGELSDLTVILADKEYRLHRFPLYTRSTYIKAFIRDHDESEHSKVTFESFPGGPETFEQVADFCYGISIQITPQNALSLRCGAEMLEMTGPENLIAKTDSFLKDLLCSAKLTKNSDKILLVLAEAFELGRTVDQLDVVDRCIEVLTDLWLRGPTRYTRVVDGCFSTSEDWGLQAKLLALPEELLFYLITKASESGSKSSLWGSLVQHLVDAKHERLKQRNLTEVEEKKKSVSEEEKEQPLESEKDAQVETDKQVEGQEEQDDAKRNSDSDSSSEGDREAETTAKQNGFAALSISSSSEEEKDKNGQPSTSVEKTENDQKQFADVLEEVFSEIPEDASLAPGMSPKWAVNSLSVASRYDCACRAKLVQITCQILHKLPSSDVANFEPTVMAEFVEKLASLENCDKVAITSVSDAYLTEKVKEGFDDVDVVQRIIAAADKEQRQQHDRVFELIETLMSKKSEDGERSLTDDQINSLFAAIDFSKLSESALQRAHDSKIVPEPFITQAALAMCTQLRTQLDTARSIIRMQEDELQRRRLVPSLDTSAYSGYGATPHKTTTYSRTVQHSYGGEDYSTRHSTSVEAGEPRGSAQTDARVDKYSSCLPSARRTVSSPLHLSLPYWEYYSTREYMDILDDMDLYDESPSEPTYDYSSQERVYPRGTYRLDLGDDYITRRLHWSLSGK